MFKGSIVALITPFNENFTINYNKLFELIEYQYICGTDALLILGTTSESSTLSEYEKDQLVDFIIRQNNKRMKIIVGVISNVTQTAIEKAIKYEKFGADGLLVTPPYYNKTNKSGLIKYFKMIAHSVNIPIILYNIPSRTSLNLDYTIISELKKVSNIIGVKESNKDINHIIDIANICDEEFSLYCGNDELSYIFLSLGAKGLINVYGNMEPKIIKNLINIFYENEFLARKYFLKYHDLFKSLSIEVNPIPIKTLMNYIGLDVGLYRLPLDVMDENNYRSLIDIYEKNQAEIVSFNLSY